MKPNDTQNFQNLYKRITQDGKIYFAGTLLQRAAKKWPDQTAIICDDESITYKELYDKATIFSHKLIEEGIKPENRVLLLWQNSIEYYIAYYGIWQTGAIVAPLNTMLHEAEITHIVKDSSPAAIVVSDSLAPKLEFQTHNFKIYYEKDLGFGETHASAPELKIPEKNEDEIAVILYTSGTTGFPKGVMLSSKNILVNIIQGASELDISKNDRIFGALPFFHALTQNCCVWGPMLFGCSVIVVPKIDRGKLLKGFTHHPTFVVGVPALYGLFCMLKNVSFESVRLFASGADALPNKIRSIFEMLYARKISNGYGLTETTPFVSVNLEDITTVPGNVGRPLPHIEIFIKDENGQTMKQGEIGTLWLKGDNVMLGYYNAPAATSAVLNNGLFNTGDLAYIDEQGNIIITGRIKDTIKNKGINIYPAEIENILLSHEHILQAAVVGKKVDIDEYPIAFVATAHPDKVTEAELKALCTNNLASYKVPRRVIIKKHLPITATGKVDKKQLTVDDIEL